jgi:hypothetical protein
MAQKKRKRQPRKTFRFQLTPGGVIGIGIVCFCLLMWMFLLGIWAGQTILLPSAPSKKSAKGSSALSGKNSPPVQVLIPEGKKKRK